jgi:hypothetical protein
MLATLKSPYLGYSRIELLEKIQYKWKVKILGSGKIIEVYEDEFVVD